jgi:hypothetical protein
MDVSRSSTSRSLVEAARSILTSKQVIDDSEQVPRSDAELLYLIFEDLGENPCPVFQERLDIHWCGFANCVPNLPTWELKSSKFHYLANYDSEGLNTLAVWDVVSGEWLQTFFPIRLSALERTCEIVTKVNPFKEPMFIDAPNIACAPPTSGHVDPVSEPQDDTPPFAEPFLSTPPEASPKGEPPTSSPIVLPAQPHYRPDTHTVVPNGTPRSSRSSRGALIGGVVGGTVAALAVVLVASVLYHLVSERAEIEGAGPSQEIHENPLYEGPTTAYDNPLYTPNLEMQQLV